MKYRKISVRTLSKQTTLSLSAITNAELLFMQWHSLCNRQNMHSEGCEGNVRSFEMTKRNRIR